MPLNSTTREIGLNIDYIFENDPRKCSRGLDRRILGYIVVPSKLSTRLTLICSFITSPQAGAPTKP